MNAISIHRSNLYHSLHCYHYNFISLDLIQFESNQSDWFRFETIARRTRCCTEHKNWIFYQCNVSFFCSIFFPSFRTLSLSLYFIQIRLDPIQLSFALFVLFHFFFHLSSLLRKLFFLFLRNAVSLSFILFVCDEIWFSWHSILFLTIPF